jgi:hypothetical protein
MSVAVDRVMLAQERLQLVPLRCLENAANGHGLRAVRPSPKCQPTKKGLPVCWENDSLCGHSMTPGLTARRPCHFSAGLTASPSRRFGRGVILAVRTGDFNRQREMPESPYLLGFVVAGPLGTTTGDGPNERPNRGLDRFRQRRPAVQDQRQVRVGLRFAGQGLGQGVEGSICNSLLSMLLLRTGRGFDSRGPVARPYRSTAKFGRFLNGRSA